MDTALNAHKGTNVGIQTTFLEIVCPPEAIFSTDTFINKQPCPPVSIQGGPPDAEPIKSRPANPRTKPVKSGLNAPGQL